MILAALPVLNTRQLNLKWLHWTKHKGEGFANNGEFAIRTCYTGDNSTVVNWKEAQLKTKIE